MGCGVGSRLDPGTEALFLEDIEEFVFIVCPVSKHLVYRVLLAAVLLRQIDKGSERPVVLQ